MAGPRTIGPGSRLGPYEILDTLGSGGMGVVYTARDTRLDRPVAVKVLRAETASDADRLLRFETEAHAVSALNHPNILTIHDVGTHEGVPYFVSELLHGQTLRRRPAGGCRCARRWNTRRKSRPALPLRMTKASSTGI